MKILYYPPYRGQQYYKHFYTKTFEILKKMGYEVINSEAISDINMVFKDSEKAGTEMYVKRYNELINKTKNCDFAIFDTTFPSLAVGYLIDYALDYHKPVIALCLKENRPSYFLANINDEKFQFIQYTEDDLEKKIKSAIEKAMQLREKRFNFFINPDLLNYLEEASKKEGVTKSTFIRNLIVEDRTKHNK